MTKIEITNANKYPVALEEAVFERFKTRIKIQGQYPDVTGFVIVGEVSDKVSELIDEFVWGFLAGNAELRIRLTGK